MAPSEATNPASKGEQRRQQILDAAISRFGRDGFRATKVAEIARDADVSGTLPHAYFDNKEALFRAALDHDAAGVINEGISKMLHDPDASLADPAWRNSLLFVLLDALDRHPLARRVLAGLEPTVTSAMIELPALAELRAAMAERLKVDQARGLVRPDVDPVAIGSGAVSIYVSLLMSVVQFGVEGVGEYGPDVLAVLSAAIDPVDPAS